MVFIEKQKKREKEYYYLTQTVRIGKRFSKIRILLTDKCKNISKKELDKLAKSKEKEFARKISEATAAVSFFSTDIDSAKIRQKYWVWERPCTVHIMHYLAGTLVVPIADNFGHGYPDTYGIFHGNIGKWVADMRSMVKSGIFIVNKLLYKDNLSKMIKDWNKITERLDRTCKETEDIKIENVSNKEFVKLYGKFHKALYDWWGFANVAELVSYAGEYLLRDSINEKDFPLLTSPTEKSYTTKQEEELLEIAVKIKNNKKALNLFNKEVSHINKKLSYFKEINGLIDEHTAKYFWLQNNFFEAKVLDKEFFINEVKMILDSNVAPAIVFKLNKKRLDAVKKDKENLIKKLNLDDKYNRLIRLLDYFCVFQDDRKIAALKANHYFEIFMNEFRRRTGISRALLNYSLPNEFEAIVNNKFDINILKKRSRYCVMYVKKQSIGILVEDDASKLEKRLLGSNNNQEIDEFEGMRAYGGKITGKVAKIFDPRSSNNFNEGDILVTTMTSPDFIHLMKKASAIITDEGGITCHAAIVARELFKPCVIATKIATDLLNDGDLVEVNANHGLVRVLARA